MQFTEFDVLYSVEKRKNGRGCRHCIFGGKMTKFNTPKFGGLRPLVLVKLHRRQGSTLGNGLGIKFGI